ncbi:MAG: hypothetical protein HY303_03085, partial [Candidatus Wallbacteria bacterium]|nr:hypothetical protein [Candidatus Wallbacteria bacterium]
KSTGRGIGFDLGSWNDVGFAFELPRIARVGSQSQIGSELSAPMVSLNYKF